MAVTVKIIRGNDETLKLLNEVVIQKDVEFILRDAGLKITAPTPEAGLYVVIVKVAATGRDNMYFAMHVQSSLSQIVQLTRDPNIKTEAQTWPAISQARFGVAPITSPKAQSKKPSKSRQKISSRTGKRLIRNRNLRQARETAEHAEKKWSKEKQ